MFPEQVCRSVNFSSLCIESKFIILNVVKSSLRLLNLKLIVPWAELSMTQSATAKSPSSRSRFSRVSFVAALIAGVFVSLAAYRYLVGGAGDRSLQLSSLSNLYKVVLARFFRDLSRYKARRRLFSNSDTSLIHLVLGMFSCYLHLYLLEPVHQPFNCNLLVNLCSSN